VVERGLREFNPAPERGSAWKVWGQLYKKKTGVIQEGGDEQLRLREVTGKVRVNSGKKKGGQHKETFHP